MSSKLTRTDIERIAALAHLELTEEEIKLFTRQLAQILEYAQQLQQVNTEDVSVQWHHGITAKPLRSDVLRPSLTRDDAIANAPESTPDGLFKVPKVIGE